MTKSHPSAQIKYTPIKPASEGQAAFIVGNVGSGKTLLARRMVWNWRRAHKPFRIMAYDQGATLWEGFNGLGGVSDNLNAYRKQIRRQDREGKSFSAAFVDTTGDSFEGWLQTIDEQQRAADNRPLLVWVEESAFPLGRHQHLHSLAGRLMRTRRHLVLCWIFTTQSPKDGPLLQRELLDRIIALRISHPAGLEYLGRIGLREHLDQIRTLPIGESLEAWSDGTVERHRKVGLV